MTNSDIFVILHFILKPDHFVVGFTFSFKPSPPNLLSLAINIMIKNKFPFFCFFILKN